MKAESDRMESTITKVYEDGHSFQCSDGWSFGGCTKEQLEAAGVVPAIGDKVVMIGEIGRPIRGVYINGRKIYYRTVTQEAKLHRQQLEAANMEKEQEFIASRERRDLTRQSLPQVFQDRLNGFEQRNPKWRVQYEPYELFCCEEAVKFANAFKTQDALKAFHAMDYEDQKKAVDMDDGHSGNTFGFSVRLASLYLSNPELIEKEHGAICPLVGCKELRCYSTTVSEPAS